MVIATSHTTMHGSMNVKKKKKIERNLSLKCQTVTYFFIFLPHRAIVPSGAGHPHYQGLAITLRHSTLDRIPLDDITWTQRPLPTQHTTLKRETSITPLGFEVAIPAK